MAKIISIRKSLLINMLLLIVILGVAIMAISHFASRKTLRTLSGSLIGQTIDRVEVELMRFFDPVTNELMLARSWGYALIGVAGGIQLYINVFLWYFEKEYVYPSNGPIRYYTYLWGNFIYWGTAALLYGILRLNGNVF